MESQPLHPSHLRSTESGLSSKAFSRKEKPLPKPKSKSKSQLQELPSPSFSKLDSEVRLTDLCPEDKARIGELVRRLALEKSQREDTESFYEQKIKSGEREKRKLEKEIEKIRASTEEYKHKYEKSMEILETYKQSQIRTSWDKQVFESPLTQSNIINSSMRVTPEPIQMISVPLSPIREKETNNASVQTVCDKEIQTSDEILPKSSYQNFSGQKDEIPQSVAVKEIKNLKDDLFLLSESVKNCNINSLRASQNLISRKESEIPKVLGIYETKNDDDKMKKLIERNQANIRKAEDLRKGQEFDIKSSEFDKPLNINMFEQSFAGRNERKINEVQKGKPQKIKIDKDFYDENLFVLVDDLEKLEDELGEPKIQSDAEESIDAKYSDFSSFSSKYEPSLDSVEELKARALRLKNSLKY